MKKWYYLLSLLGFILPNIFVLRESLLTGNILLWRDFSATFEGMFANNISSAFGVDLLWVVLVFFLWSWWEAQRYSIKNLWLIWIATMLLGLAGTFPLFLAIREDKKAMAN